MADEGPYFRRIIPPGVQRKMDARGITEEDILHILSTNAVFTASRGTQRVKLKARRKGKRMLLVVDLHGDGAYTVVSIHFKTPRRP